MNPTNRAGLSARREFERRATRDRANARELLPIKYVLLAFVVPVTYFTTKAFVAPLVQATPDQAHAISLAFAFVALAHLAQQMFGARPTTESFRIGAEGEERVGSRLDRLAAHTYVVLHDLPMPGGGNLDHVVVGPGGVFTVETKNAQGTVAIDRDVIRVNGRRRNENVEQALRQAAEMRARLSADPAFATVPVTPVLCYARADIRRGWFTPNVVSGVHITGIAQLTRMIEASKPGLTAEQVERVASLIEQPRRVAVAAACVKCSSEMVVRTRKKDGEKFLGCSRFPKCWSARPLEETG